MTNIDNGGPVFPGKTMQGHTRDLGGGLTETTYREVENSGMSLRQYAAIKLRVPNSGTGWLDDMIREAKRDELAAQAMQGIIASCSEGWVKSPDAARWAYEYADEALAAREPAA